jgi:hypothetical protein
MDEKDTVSQSQSSEPVKTSKWAKIAPWCVGFGYLTSIFWCLTLADNFFVFFVTPLISAVSIIVGLTTSIIALIHIILSKGRLKGTGKAITSIILSLIYIFIVCVILYPAISHIRMMKQRDVCPEHLFALGKSLKIYADEHGTYPAADKWCDILSQRNDVNETLFKCPYNKKARCSYAINPNCEPNSTGDVVLLFETKGGWNTFGGPELLSIDNHIKGEGAFILFNDGHVMFNIADPNGKIINELNWGEKRKGRDLK